MAEREKNFVSAVVYLGEERGQVEPFFTTLCDALAQRFDQFELVLVDDASRDGTPDAVKEYLAGRETPLPATLIHMSLKQGRELAMNAGLDMAIGDFVYEFDTLHMPYPEEMILQAYDACLAGSDIVSVAPAKNRRLTSSLFYRLFNSSSGSKYKLHTDVFRLLSRRAINRVHSIASTVPYRKATYATSGLKMETLAFAGSAGPLEEHLRASRAMDSLALYTNVGYKASLGIAIVMLVLMVASLAYTFAIRLLLGPQSISEGWTTLMLLSTGGFFGVFLILSIVLKYLSLLVELVFKKQTYLVESVEKLQ